MSQVQGLLFRVWRTSGSCGRGWSPAFGTPVPGHRLVVLACGKVRCNRCKKCGTVVKVGRRREVNHKFYPKKWAHTHDRPARRRLALAEAASGLGPSGETTHYCTLTPTLSGTAASAQCDR